MVEKLDVDPNYRLTGWTQLQGTSSTTFTWNAEDISIFAIACLCASPEVIKYLHKTAGADLDEKHFVSAAVGEVKLSQPLPLIAIFRGDIVTLAYMADVLEMDLTESIGSPEEDDIPILLAIRYDSFPAVRYLVENLAIDFTEQFETKAGEMTMVEYARHSARIAKREDSETVQYLESLVSARTWAGLRSKFQTHLLDDIRVIAGDSVLLLDEIRDLVTHQPAELSVTSKLRTCTQLLCWAAANNLDSRIACDSYVGCVPFDIVEKVARFVRANPRTWRCRSTCEELFHTLAASEAMETRRDLDKYGTALELSSRGTCTIVEKVHSSDAIVFASKQEAHMFQKLFAPEAFSSEDFQWRALQLRKRFLSDADWLLLTSRLQQVDNRTHRFGQLESQICVMQEQANRVEQMLSAPSGGTNIPRSSSYPQATSRQTETPITPVAMVSARAGVSHNSMGMQDFGDAKAEVIGLRLELEAAKAAKDEATEAAAASQQKKEQAHERSMEEVIRLRLELEAAKAAKDEATEAAATEVIGLRLELEAAKAAKYELISKLAEAQAAAVVAGQVVE
jgi:hypothetical protein